MSERLDNWSRVLGRDVDPDELGEVHLMREFIDNLADLVNSQQPGDNQREDPGGRPVRMRSFDYYDGDRMRAKCACGWVGRLTRDLGLAQYDYGKHVCYAGGEVDA